MRTTLRLLVACAAISWPVARELRAQTDPLADAVREGERVRLTLARPLGARVVGWLVRFDPDTMAVRTATGVLARVAVANVVMVEASEGPVGRAREIRTGALIGLAGGAAIGFILGGRQGIFVGPSEQRAFAGTLIVYFGASGALIGAAGGVLSGIGTDTERWVTRATPLAAAPAAAPAARPDGDPASRPSTPIVRGLAIGTRVRVQVAGRWPDIIGRVTGLDDSLRVRTDDHRDVPLSWPEVQGIQRSLGRPAFMGRSFYPVIAGALIGAELLPRVSTVLGPDCVPATDCSNRPDTMIAGALLGAGVGLIIGERRREEQWDPVPLVPTLP